jgi:hypothetical protein
MHFDNQNTHFQVKLEKCKVNNIMTLGDMCEEQLFADHKPIFSQEVGHVDVSHSCLTFVFSGAKDKSSSRS